MAGYFLSEFLPKICWEEIGEDVFFFIFRFDAWPGIGTRVLRLISQHTIYYTMTISKNFSDENNFAIIKSCVSNIINDIFEMGTN